MIEAPLARLTALLLTEENRRGRHNILAAAAGFANPAFTTE